MKVQIFLIFVVFNIQINATLYRKGEDLDPNEVELLFRQDTPSQINCANRCVLKKGDFVYNKGKCTCFVYLKDKTKKSGIHPETLTETFYEKENVCLIGNGGCHPDAQCTNNIRTNGAISCTCNPGYSGNGLTCTDVDESLTNNGDCHANANCINTIGSKNCSCKNGYNGNGSNCTDIDECLTNNGDCHANAYCNNTIGSRTCSCKDGYKGDGLTCNCKEGYNDDGLTCTDIDECLTNNGDCDVNANCINTIGSRNCSCKNGYTVNGLNCTAPCQKVNKTMAADLITGFFNVKTWQQCARKCMDEPTCAVWRWYTPLYVRASLREKCSLYSSKTYTRTSNNAISGIRGCVG